MTDGRRKRQRRTAMRKAFKELPKPDCFHPKKIKYWSFIKASAAADSLGLRCYQCGDHYHLTKLANFRLSR